jgi:hypothetical protein
VKVLELAKWLITQDLRIKSAFDSHVFYVKSIMSKPESGASCIYLHCDMQYDLLINDYYDNIFIGCLLVFLI